MSKKVAVFLIIAISIIGIIVYVYINNKKEGNEKMDNQESKVKVEIHVKDKGVIALELEPNQAPITVDNFVSLAKSGFYDGLTFHRIINGFMMQGGDPLGNGTGGSENTIKGEFKNNGVQNTMNHTRGVISMARSGMPNSASSQFFIVHKDSKFLDGQYAGFGHVTSGMEIVDQICEETPVVDSNGTVQEGMAPIMEKVVVIEGE